MKDFQFWNPTRIVFGEDAIEQIGKEIKRYDIKKILLIYGQGSIKRNKTYDRVIHSIKQQQIEYVEYSGIKSNPLLSDVQEAIKLGKEYQVEAILAVGGGSVIDSAKAVAAGIEYEGNVWDLFIGTGEIEDAMPIFTVLTLSASSSEMNPCAVLTDDKARVKLAFSSAGLFPDISFIDPKCQFTVPKEYIAFGSIDAISHLMEIYLNCEHYSSIVQNRTTYMLIDTIMATTERVLTDPQNYNARADLIWSILLSFNGSVTAGRGFYYFPCHVLEHSLSALYDIPHGAGLSILLPAWMKWKYQYQSNRMAHLFENLFGEISGTNERVMDGVDEGIREFKGWCQKIGAPVSLQHYNINIDRDHSQILKNMNAHIHQCNLQDELTDEALMEILEYAK